MTGERLEQAVQCTRGLGMARRQEQRGAVLTARTEAAPTDHEETRGVIRAILDVRGEHLEAIDLGRRGAGDRRRTALVAGAPRRLSVARLGESLRLGQVLVKPLATLGERLRMTADAFYLAQRSHPAHEILADAQLHLPAYEQRRTQETIERVVDAALGRVLDRHPAEIGMPRFDLAEHLVDGPQRERTGRVPEMLVDRGLGERPLRPEEPDLEGFFLGEAGRHDLAEQAHDLLVTQRALGARRRIALQRHPQHLRFTLRAVEVDEPSLFAFGDPDLARQARTLVEQRVKFTVDRIDTPPQAFDPRARHRRISADGLRAGLERPLDRPLGGRLGGGPGRRSTGSDGHDRSDGVTEDACRRVPRRGGDCEPGRPWRATSTVATLELAHERDQRLHTGHRHGVVDRGPHATLQSMALEVDETLCRCQGAERSLEGGISDPERHIHPRAAVGRDRAAVEA